MSLLQRLNERAKELSGQQTQVVDAKQEQRRRFEQETVPALQELEQFLRSLNHTLKLAKPEVRQSYQLPGYGGFQAVPNFEWQIQADNKSNEYSLEIKWKARVDTDKAARVSLAGYERIRMLNESFKRFGLGGVREEQRGPSGLAIQATAQATGFVHCKLLVRAGLEDESVYFFFENIDQLATIRRQLPIDVLGSEVHDRLGEFILRENDLFVREAWVRGLKAVIRIPKTADAAPESKSKVTSDDSLEALAASFATLPSNLTTTQARQEMHVKEAPRVAPVSSPTTEQPSQPANAEDRELDFLAELKFAARYADNAVKKNLDTTENNFGNERDLSSLRSSYQHQQAEQSARDLKSGLAPSGQDPGLQLVQQAENLASLVQAPAVQTPAVQSPAVQSPAVQSPAVQSPAVQSPVAQKASVIQSEPREPAPPIVTRSPAPTSAPQATQKSSEELPTKPVSSTEHAKAGETDFLARMLEAKEKFAKKYSK